MMVAPEKNEKTLISYKPRHFFQHLKYLHVYMLQRGRSPSWVSDHHQKRTPGRVEALGSVSVNHSLTLPGVKMVPALCGRTECGVGMRMTANLAAWLCVKVQTGNNSESCLFYSNFLGGGWGGGGGGSGEKMKLVKLLQDLRVC